MASLKVGAKRIGRWYTSLLQEHELPLRSGLLMDPRKLRTDQILTYVQTGAKLHNKKIPGRYSSEWIVGTGIHQRDYRTWIAVKSWQKKRPKWVSGEIPPHWTSYSIGREELLSFIEEGYWLEYLSGLTGHTVEQVLGG
jgi:hypothetical protein